MIYFWCLIIVSKNDRVFLFFKFVYFINIRSVCGPFNLRNGLRNFLVNWLSGCFYFMSKLISYLNLIRFFNPIGFWLLLWPGLWGLFLSKNMDISYFTIVVLGSFLTRSVGCAINDIIDLQYDKKVERTKNRPLANGDLSLKEALIFTVILAAACLYLLSLTNMQTICLVLFVAVPMIIIYPLMKRFVSVPQLFLGATFGLS